MVKTLLVQSVSMNLKPKLLIDIVGFKAAKFACERWHYSEIIPVGRLIRYGVWENDKYIGCVIFSRGACPSIGKTYKLKQTEACELTRIALNKHKTPVSRIIGIAIKLLKISNPNMKLLISYSDKGRNHHGGIYQASNWIYVKDIKSSGIDYFVRGKWRHSRSISSELRQSIPKRNRSGKYKYVYVLDRSIKEKILMIQITEELVNFL